ncbi:hypothetical protein LTR94_028860, partial [Friedmanniomyces endolithicus]
VLAQGELEFRRVVMVCPGLASAPFVELQTIQDGRPGVRLVSACRPVGVDANLLVDRGFIPDDKPERPRILRTSLPLVFMGELRTAPAKSALAPAPSNGRFFARDTEAMASALEVREPILSQTVFALSEVNPELGLVEPSAPPAAFSNNHLGYALTWFGLAAAALAFYAALLRRRLKKDTP